MSLYDDILRNAPGETHTAAGDLHEELWNRLLRLEDPNFHNVRLGRGDGGIDGFVLVDPVLPKVQIYQAKYYNELTLPRHRTEVKDAFITAHSHRFPCVTWTLLIPFNLSAPELNWLVTQLRSDAIAERIDLEERIRGCAIRYLDVDDLELRLGRHMTVAEELIPHSVAALLGRLEAERARAHRVEEDISKRVELILEDAIRRRDVEVRQAKAWLAILSQGWADHTSMMALRHRRDRTIGHDTLERETREFLGFVESKMNAASHAESLVVDVSSRITEIHSELRWLLQSRVLEAENMPPTRNVDDLVASILAKCRDLATDVGRARLGY